MAGKSRKRVCQPTGPSLSGSYVVLSSLVLVGSVGNDDGEDTLVDVDNPRSEKLVTGASASADGHLVLVAVQRSFDPNDDDNGVNNDGCIGVHTG